MAVRTRKVTAQILSPPTPSHDDPSWRGARTLTHQWLGSCEHERLDATDRVWRALQHAARTGRIPVVAEPLGDVTLESVY